MRDTRGLAAAGLGWAALGIAAGALMMPERMARAMRVDRSAVRVIAVRDLVSAWLLLGGGGSPALLVRAAFDLGDVALMVRRRPLFAVLAAGSAVVALRSALDR